MNILVIEDEPILMMDYQFQAEMHPNHGFAYAVDLQGALRRLDETPTDIVFSDFVFPGISRGANDGGVLFFRQAQERFPGLPFFFVSSHSRQYMENALRESGTSAHFPPRENYFQKPVALATLIEAAESRYAAPRPVARIASKIGALNRPVPVA